LDFVAVVEIGRLFDGIECNDAIDRAPDSVSIDVRAHCAACGKAVRFEGPIGVAVGPGAPPMVSVNGLELRAAGHLGENRTPPVRAQLRYGS
jgi:hypothetical protein